MPWTCAQFHRHGFFAALRNVSEPMNTFDPASLGGLLSELRHSLPCWQSTSRGYPLKSTAFLFASFFLSLIVSTPCALAQSVVDQPALDPPALVRPARARQDDRTNEDRVSVIRVGGFFGRTGSAIGSSAYAEVNPIRWVGLCGFAAHSRDTTINQGDPVVEWDSTVGGCVTSHLPSFMGILISPFAQYTIQCDHNRVSIPLGDGTNYVSTQNQTNHLWTAGSSIDRAIVKDGPRWIARIGKNFGQGPAAQHGSGLYLVGGVVFPLDHPVKLARSFPRMVGLNLK